MKLLSYWGIYLRQTSSTVFVNSQTTPAQWESAGPGSVLSAISRNDARLENQRLVDPRDPFDDR